MDPVETTIKDRQGNPHRYEIYPQKPTEALPDVLQLLAMGAQPLSRVIEIYLNAEELDPQELDEFAGSLDWSLIGADIKASLQTLDPQIARRMFRKVMRDGADLGVDAVYDKAFTGNWAEYFKALWAVIQANGFLDFAGSFSTTGDE